jgi:hypothetical protein
MHVMHLICGRSAGTRFFNHYFVGMVTARVLLAGDTRCIALRDALLYVMPMTATQRENICNYSRCFCYLIVSVFAGAAYESCDRITVAIP